MPQALIIGAGIGGTAAALALDKAGLAVAVCESHPDSGADIGAFLTLASNGMLALGQLDAAPAVVEVGFPLTSMRVVDATGAELATVPLGEFDNPLTRSAACGARSWGRHCGLRPSAAASRSGTVGGSPRSMRTPTA